MMWLFPSNTKLKSSHILQKILLQVNTVPWGSWGTHGSCLTHAVHETILLADTEDRAHADQIKSNSLISPLPPQSLHKFRILQICPIQSFLQKSCKKLEAVIHQYSSKILLPLYSKNQKLMKKIARPKKNREGGILNPIQQVLEQYFPTAMYEQIGNSECFW